MTIEQARRFATQIITVFEDQSQQRQIKLLEMKRIYTGGKQW